MLITVHDIRNRLPNLLGFTICHGRRILLLLNGFSAPLVQFLRHNAVEV
jgi:hypothetical protein